MHADPLVKYKKINIPEDSKIYQSLLLKEGKQNNGLKLLLPKIHKTKASHVMAKYLK